MIKTYRCLLDNAYVRAVQWENFSHTNSDEIQQVCPYIEWISGTENLLLRIPPSYTYQSSSLPHSIFSYIVRVIAGGQMHPTGKYCLYHKETFEQMFVPVTGD